MARDLERDGEHGAALEALVGAQLTAGVEVAALAEPSRHLELRRVGTWIVVRGSRLHPRGEELAPGQRPHVGRGRCRPRVDTSLDGVADGRLADALAPVLGHLILLVTVGR